jgi:hypothetical protein
MNRQTVLIVVLSLLSTVFLSSCEDPENQIIGLWLMDSYQQTVYEDEELSATATYFYADDEAIRWEFQALDLLVYEGEDMELEQTYSWVIENSETLVLSRENRDDIEFEILTLTRKELVVKEEEYRTDGNILTVIEKVYNLTSVEE